MRIVATSDTHFEFTMGKFPVLGEGDVLIHAGDAMYSGYPDEWPGIKASFGALPQKLKYFVPGNHDLHVKVYEGPACAQMRKDAKVFVGGVRGRDVVELPNGMKMLMLPYVTGLEGWAYNVPEEWLLEHISAVTEGIDIEVVVSHSPPLYMMDSTKPLNKEQGENYGAAAYNKWFYERHAVNKAPLVWICGHIHENYGHDMIDGCHFYNVAMCDRFYNQVNQPMVIDL